MGSSDCVPTVDIRWTADEISAVESYYVLSEDAWLPHIYAVQGLDWQNLLVCSWPHFSRRDNWSDEYVREGCDAVKNNLPDYGTVIVYSW